MKDKVEAILFAAGRFLDEETIAKLLQADVRTVRKALTELKEAYEKHHEGSLQVVQEQNSWKLHVKDSYLELVSKLVSEKEIATTVLETLAIVAWKNPAMQAELIKIRGPAAYEHVAELIERGFITKEPEGRSFKLKVTDKFFEYFDIEGRDDLKKLFKGVEDKAAQDQAAIDRASADYEAQKQAAVAAQAALDAGKDPSSIIPLNTIASLPAGSAHSAQNTVASLIAEVKGELEKMDAPTPTEQLVAEAKEELHALEHDIHELKEAPPTFDSATDEPTPIPSNQMPIHKRAPRKKTHHK